jgi:hypothetical protein
MIPGVAAAYLGMIISRPATNKAAVEVSHGARRRRLGRRACAVATAGRADAARGGWKGDPSLVENDYYRLVNQPRG